ncbi:MAG: hypothetical protein QS748_14390 [Candidatus Endonucleobacter bathymodioli]|uniref:Uncharacterized protein n=1 Tax=Candidatus Endonucleibacter bathymodioli TaxID=539814 RepID=A0AA90NNX7_9GAMM|nr:hypothetical protein [Candidatus Endonucleobacter bathymodioli]
MVRFRTRLVRHHLWGSIIDEINGRLEGTNISMSEGSINIIAVTRIWARGLAIMLWQRERRNADKKYCSGLAR